MEEHGPEAMKDGLDTAYSAPPHRSQQHPVASSHGYSAHTLPPRNSYPPGANPTPPSPYYEAGPHEHDRALPPPSAHQSYTSHSGHNTPVRDQRHYAPDPAYSRRGSASATTRSPESTYQQYPSGRPVNSSEGHYASSYPSDSANHAVGYPNTDGTMNGHQHGLPMPTYPETTPVSVGRPPEYGHSPVNVPPSGYPGTPYSAQANYQTLQRMRKGNRATQACDVCRQRKAKCDEGRPKCSHCVENGLQCNYQTVAPAKADRANQAIMDHLAAQDREMAAQDQKLENFRAMVAPIPQLQSSIERIENLLMNSGSPRVPLGAASVTQERRSLNRQLHNSESPQRKVTPDISMAPSVLSQTPSNREPMPTREPKVEASPSASYKTASSEPLSDPSSVNPFVNVPVEHTTAAHRLLAWPSIRKLVNSHKTLRHLAVEDYVMRMEEASGVLRVYGRGEGVDQGDGTQDKDNPNSPASNASTGRSEDSADSPSPPPWIWGAGTISPVTSPCSSPPSAPGELPDDFDFSLNIHPKTLRRLLDSYLSNIHILHPFLDKSQLTTSVAKFAIRYNPTEERLTTSLFPGTLKEKTIDHLRSISPWAQRNGRPTRFDGHTKTFATESNLSSGQRNPEIAFERSISTATILLVLALGRMCEWKKPLPGIRHLNEPKERNIGLHFASLNGHGQSPRHFSHGMSPLSSSYVMGKTSVPSPVSNYPQNLPSPKSTVDESIRNIDVVPGLSYYAPATDILGNLHGSNDLAHVQAYLLAGLFIGQMARTFESFNWISSACRACRFLVRDPTLATVKEPRRNKIKFAFWTCSQLESDILAELDLPRSGIQELREVPYPSGYVEPGDYSSWDSDTQIMGYYSGQIHIRNQLNDIQKDLYAPENIERATRGFKLRDAMVENLDHWRQYVPPSLSWRDTDHPHHNINAARLRAKYYGAQYIIHRPFLRYALDHEIFSDMSSPGSMPPPNALGHFERDQILKSCRTCVQAAMSSTIAFDGIIYSNVPRRLIVTNIFGTAHAQFGNILVLSATYKSKSSVLSSLVPREKLEHLFERTISFLRSLMPLSESLERDARILEALRELVFETRPVGSSFSSMDS